MTTKWKVRIENGKREHWDTVPATSETDARMQAAKITDVNRSWTAYVKRDGEQVAKYKRGAPVKTRASKAKKAPGTPPAQPSALESVELLRAFIKAKSEGTEMRDAIHALDSLVSEVRAEERAKCISDAVQIREECERNSGQATADNLITAWHDAAAGAKRVEDAISARR